MFCSRISGSFTPTTDRAGRGGYLGVGRAEQVWAHQAAMRGSCEGAGERELATPGVEVTLLQQNAEGAAERWSSACLSSFKQQLSGQISAF